MSERHFGAAQLLLLPDPNPWCSRAGLPCPLPLTHHPVVALAAALPGCFIYLFCTNRVAADSFSPGLKRERGKKKKEKCFLVLFSASVLAAVAAAATAAAGGQAGGQGAVGVSTQGRCGPRCSSNGTGPQPRTDAVPNLRRPSSFSGKCPHLLSQCCNCPSP